MRVRVLGGAFLLAALVTYGPSLEGEFLWDDDRYVPAPEMRSLEGLARIWLEPGATLQYYPVTYSVFWLEHRLWGDRTLGYHVVNVTLHAGGALLAWRVLHRLTVPGALFAAALFLLHPVQVESVAWITELKNTLSGSFYFAALLVYLPFALGAPGERTRGRYVAALALFLGAILSKSVTATLPAAALLIVWWKRGRLRWHDDVRPLLPFFALGAAVGLHTTWLEFHQVGAQGAPYALSWTQRLVLAGHVPWFYLGKLVWPANLTFIYPRWTIDTAHWSSFVPLLAAASVVATLWLLRHHIGRAPLAAVLYFGGTLFPVLGFFNVYPFRYSYVADHFQYLASLGLFGLVAGTLVQGVGRARASQAAAVALLLPLAWLSWRQAEDYRDSETLWRATLRRNPDCWMAHNNLGTILRARGQIAEAIAHYRRAIALDPAAANPHYNLANALRTQADDATAVVHYQTAVALEPDNPFYRVNLGNTLSSQRRWEEAIAQYERALTLGPEIPIARLNLGLALAQAGRLDEAIEQLRAVVRQHPEIADARSLLARLEAQRGAGE